jgi:hypothetical protein
MRPEHGVYCVSPSCSWRGLDNRDGTEKTIRAFLRQCGGVARTRDILDELVDRRISGPEDHDYHHRLVRTTLRAGFCQDFGRGRWNLPSDEMDKIPLLGWVADYNIQCGWPASGAQSGFPTWEAQRTDFFRRVGAAFRMARGERSAADVALHPDAETVLIGMGHKAPSARRDALHALREQVEGELHAEGITDRWAIESEARRREDADLPLHLYDAFERGSVELHLAAPADLYRLFGSILEVCPVRLSRGEVAPNDGGLVEEKRGDATAGGEIARAI